jgi:cyanophycinase-like exopeptidase
MTPRIILVGGWEFIKEDGIDEEIAKLASGKIVLISAATNFPERSINWAVEKYKKYQTEVLLLEEGVTAIPPEIKVVYMSGGHPEKLMEYLARHQELWQDIKSKWLNQEIILCGSSTGAMVMFKEMLAHGSRGSGDTKLMPGLGLIKNHAMVIPHWDKADDSPEWRARILMAHQDKLLITIDEYTALFWGDNKAKVVGLGKINIVAHGQMVTYTNSQMVLDLVLED